MYLGLVKPPRQMLRTIYEFLVHGEKLMCSPAVIQRHRSTAPVQPPPAPAEHVVFAPLEQAPLRPDLVVFLCTPWQAARLIHLAYYETGEHMHCDPTGSMCYSAITYPIFSGNINVTMGDITARKWERLPEELLFVSVPYSHMHTIMASIDHCSAGTAPVEIPASMRKLMRQHAQRQEEA